MSENDFPELHDLGRAAEEYARPLPAAEVRRLGRRRRNRRRVTAAVVALVAVVAAGSTLVGTGRLGTDRAPEVVASPMPTPTSPASTRTVDEQNLITAAEVPPNWGDDRLSITEPGVGRPIQAITVCVPDAGWSTLPIASAATRNFRIDYQPPGFVPGTDSPMYEQPQFYTAALQFADRPSADAAAATIRGWLTSCGSRLAARGDRVGGQRTRFVTVPARDSSATVGEYAALPTYLPTDVTPPSAEPEGTFFEHVGLTQVDDRLMLIVEVVFGTEYHDSDQPGGDPKTQLPANVQFGLIRAAAERLAR